MALICATFFSKTTQQTIRDLKKASNADLVELRLDEAERVNFQKILSKKTKPVIIACRDKTNGGRFQGTEEQRINLLKKALRYKPKYIDLESDIDKEIIKELRKKAKLIISYHNFKNTPKNLEKTVAEIKKLKPDMIKIVTTANEIEDNLTIFNLLKKNNKITAFCMGEQGKTSRILAPIFGSLMTYASLEKNNLTAEGQLTLNELTKVYNFNNLNKKTRIYGLIGNPVEHSMSPLIHNASFKKQKINAVYVLFKVSNVKFFLNNFKNLTEGFSVTIPHKITAMKHLNCIEKSAKKIGAINTVVNKKGKLYGYNTDCIGAIKALETKTRIRNKKILLIGAGGAAKAIATGLKNKGAKITITNRTLNKAKALAKSITCDYKPLSALKETIKGQDIIINATSVGMYPGIKKTIIPKQLLKKVLIMDIVYNPLRTKLIKDAENNNCKTILGIEMFIEQAAEQFKLFTGKKAPKQLMRKLVEQQLR